MANEADPVAAAQYLASFLKVRFEMYIAKRLAHLCVHGGLLCLGESAMCKEEMVVEPAGSMNLAERGLTCDRWQKAGLLAERGRLRRFGIQKPDEEDSCTGEISDRLYKAVNLGDFRRRAYSLTGP